MGFVGGPTLAVVAREAGVSVPTASKVVNGRQDVAPETRRRVTEALDRLGYVRRRRAASAALVDLVVPSLGGAGAAEVLRGVEEAAHAAGLEVVVSTGPARARGWRDRVMTRGTSGVLFLRSGLTPAQYAWLDRHDVPFGLIDPVLEAPPGVLSVVAAERQGAVEATEHLLGLGHERVAVTGGDRRSRCGVARVAGFRAALAAAGMRPRPEYVRYGDRMRELLDLPQPPTAVLVCSDVLTSGVCEALAERKVRVPGDMSVVCFGDVPSGHGLTPGPTTVRLPLAEMAATALRLVTGQETSGTQAVEVATRLVVRGSTAAGPAPGGPVRVARPAPGLGSGVRPD
ncbi:LacI family DNA-binding transcriptional regulator [Streptomyces sp. NPDC050400]|uniref:LacI family DNA-binding transcriptional regulator n=1 Tax=Streptomyces sp. NPDC050400 TaxID=3365610 RepID=UPI0037A7E13E